MNGAYLEVTFQHGRPLAAYYYLPRRTGDRAARTKRGPSAAMNRVLRSVGCPPVKRAELLPVLAA